MKLWQCFGRLSFHIDQPLEASDCLVARWHASGTGKRSGIDVDMGGYCLFCMRDAKVLRVEFFESEGAALEAASLTTR